MPWSAKNQGKVAVWSEIKIMQKTNPGAVDMTFKPVHDYEKVVQCHVINS